MWFFHGRILQQALIFIEDSQIFWDWCDYRPCICLVVDVKSVKLDKTIRWNPLGSILPPIPPQGAYKCRKSVLN